MPRVEIEARSAERGSCSMKVIERENDAKSDGENNFTNRSQTRLSRSVARW